MARIAPKVRFRGLLPAFSPKYLPIYLIIRTFGAICAKTDDVFSESQSLAREEGKEEERKEGFLRLVQALKTVDANGNAYANPAINAARARALPDKGVSRYLPLKAASAS